MAEEDRDSFLRNFEKWKILGKRKMDYTSYEVCEIQTLDGQWEYLKSWLEESLAYLNSEYAE